MSWMNVLALQMPGAFEWILIAGLGLLIFGKRLPEVGRSLGQGIVEFKKGLKGIDEDLDRGDRGISSTPKSDPGTTERRLPSESNADRA